MKNAHLAPAVLKIVKAEAWKFVKKLGVVFLFDEAVSEALATAIPEILEKFDPTRAKLNTYAPRIVRYRLTDWMRMHEASPIPGMTAGRGFIKDKRLGDADPHGEVYSANRIRAQRFAQVIRLDRIAKTADIERRTIGCFIPDPRQDPNSEEAIETVERKEVLAKMLSSLSKRERELILLYYWEGLNLREVGEILDVSESRACQIHTYILETLRTSFRGIFSQAS